MFGIDNMVSWKDYDGIEGFGNATQGDVDNLNKALSAGQEINPPGSAVAGDGFALRVESLERTLKNTTFKMEHIRFWRGIPKLAAYNTVEEHNVFGGLGSAVCETVCACKPAVVLRVGIPDRFGESGAYPEILRRAGLDAEHVTQTARRAIELKAGT